MSHYFFDSSALVKRYVVETGTEWVNSVCNVPDTTLYLARISGAEIIAALFQQVRTGSLTLSDAQAAATQFKTDFQNYYQIVEITESLIDTAMILAEKHGLRGYDSVQLAAAIELQKVRASLSLSKLTFVCADDQLNNAAAIETLLIENPNRQH